MNQPLQSEVLEKTMHSTAKEADTIAEAKVKHLILGHYSTRYEISVF
jgi:ribonuclease BN (tRNA processing enzyme)